MGLTTKKNKDKSINYAQYISSYTPEKIAEIIKDFLPDIIIHCAGSSSVANSVANPMLDFENSVVVFKNLLEGIRLSKKRPLVLYPSSAAVYGNPIILPVGEDSQLKPVSPYGYHKLICEKLAEEYVLLYGIPILAIRLFSIFGVMQKKLIIWELFEQFMDKNKDEIIVKGTGEETRDYIYIDDFLNVSDELLNIFNNQFQILNLASGISYSIKEIAYLIKKYLKSDKSIIFKGEILPGNPLYWQADISVLIGLMEKKIEFDFKDRLKICINKWENNFYELQGMK